MGPIHEKDGKWYFWDESQSEEYGPYSTREEAEKELVAYIKRLG